MTQSVLSSCPIAMSHSCPLSAPPNSHSLHCWHCPSHSDTLVQRMSSSVHHILRKKIWGAKGCCISNFVMIE
ncbi:hypothetical protein BJV74DRAFT_838233 [Russula compacta]|nr:hypothetical protein BJV74DRAFT_838233 [Russula compacta]